METFFKFYILILTLWTLSSNLLFFFLLNDTCRNPIGKVAELCTHAILSVHKNDLRSIYPPPLLPSRGSDVTLLVVKGAKKVAREKKIETSEVLYSTAR